MALAIAGCGADDSAVEGPVTVYVSLPLTGERADDGDDAADGARLALAQAGGRTGELEVRARYLDDARGGVWDPVAVGRNARRAVQDSSTVAYIGELDSEPTRASAPITNDAGITQISPGASGIDLTRPAEGYPDSPGRYRPSGAITFARVIPSDAEQVRALAEWTGDLGLKEIVGLSTGGPFADLMLSEFADDAAEVGVEVSGAGGEGSGGSPLARGNGAFLAGEGAGDGDIGPGILKSDAGRTTSGALEPSRLPRSSFIDDFSARFGREPGPYAAYGFEAMRVVLEAIEAARGKDEFRSAVADAVFDSAHPDSVLGAFSITADGDTTLCAIQRYEDRGGGLVPRAAACPRD